MLCFEVDIKSGLPAYEQVVYVVKKALVAGVLKPDERLKSYDGLFTAEFLH